MNCFSCPFFSVGGWLAWVEGGVYSWRIYLELNYKVQKNWSDIVDQQYMYDHQIKYSTVQYSATPCASIRATEKRHRPLPPSISCHAQEDTERL
jgi:hypothetical protein